MKRVLSFILMFAMILSCFGGISISTYAAQTEQRLNLNTRYAYSYPGIKAVSGDDTGTVLTDGKTDTSSVFTVQNETLTTGSWNDRKNIDLFIEGKDPHYYVQNDFGFVSKVNRVELNFNTNSEAVLPTSVDVYISNDGYNYYIYPSQKTEITSKNGSSVYTVTFNEEVKAKGVKVFVYTPSGTKVSMSELSVYGIPNENERILVSKGASYEWTGIDIGGFGTDADNTLLTDGYIAGLNETNQFIGMGPSKTDDVSSSSVSEIDVDLKEIKNVSDVGFLAFSNGSVAIPDYITVRYSADGISYYDLGQSYQMGQWGYGNTFTQYSVMRNHTVKARYLKILIRGSAVISEIEVYGSKNAIAEMDYGFEDKNEVTGHTNVAENAVITVNDKEVKTLADLDYTNTYSELTKNTTNTIVVDLPEAKENVNGVMLYFQETALMGIPENVETYVSENGTDYVKVKSEFSTHKTSDKVVYRQYFDNRKAKKVKFVIDANYSKKTRLLEIGVYADQPQLPLFRGGFFQMHTTNYNSEIAVIKNSEYMWYLQLKGMKEAGMDYVVMQYGADFTNKRTAFNSPRLFAKGYSLGYGYGSKDPYTTILEAAKKLGMKVYLGSIYTYGSFDAIMEAGGLDHIKDVVADGLDLIRDMYDNYSHYESFAGYYIADETCDAWLNRTGGLNLYRSLYLPQSNLIRELDPERKIMISPAIWRSGTYAKGEENLYQLIKPEEEGGRPVVDIVAAQDCLGREDSLAVSDSAYRSYENYAQAWAKGVRRAGAQFWQDAEVFEITYQSKRYADDLDSMEMQSKYTNGIIVFDIPHYLSEVSQGAINSWKRFDISSILANYSKRYYTQYKELDRVGRDCTPVKPYKMKFTNYGLSYEEGEMPGYATGKINKVENFELTSPINYNTYNAFKDLKGGKGRYTLMWDDENLYIAVKTNDTTDNAFASASDWYTAEGDLLQIWFSPSGTAFKGDNISNTKNGIRLTVTRLANDNWVAKIQDAGVNIGNLNETNHEMRISKDKNGGVEISLALSWDKLFNITTPVIGDKVNYKIQYVDNGLWSSSDGDFGNNVANIEALDGIYPHYDELPVVTDEEPTEEPEPTEEVIDVVKNDNIQETSPEKERIYVTPKEDAKSIDIKLDTDRKYTLYADKECKKEITKEISLAEQITKIYAELDNDRMIEIIIERAPLEVTFNDVDENAWYYPYLDKIKSKGFVKGQNYNETDKTADFYPGENATRIDAAIFVLRMIGIDSTQFSDVEINFSDYDANAAENSWSVNYIKAAYYLGLIKGYEEDGVLKLKGKNPISRAEFFALFARVAMKDYDGSDFSNVTFDKYQDKEDIEEVASWCGKELKFLIHTGMLEGNDENKLLPKATIKRQEIVKLIAVYTD